MFECLQTMTPTCPPCHPGIIRVTLDMAVKTVDAPGPRKIFPPALKGSVRAVLQLAWYWYRYRFMYGIQS